MESLELESKELKVVVFTMELTIHANTMPSRVANVMKIGLGDCQIDPFGNKESIEFPTCKVTCFGAAPPKCFWRWGVFVWELPVESAQCR